MAASVAYYADHPTEISDRLRQLDQEWELERAAATIAGSASLLGLGMALLGKRRWLMVPLVAQGMLLDFQLRGQCSSLPALRRLGLRTRDEIARERYALKALRGDFRKVYAGGDGSHGDASLEAVDSPDER